MTRPALTALRASAYESGHTCDAAVVAPVLAWLGRGGGGVSRRPGPGVPSPRRGSPINQASPTKYLPNFGIIGKLLGMSKRDSLLEYAESVKDLKSLIVGTRPRLSIFSHINTIN